MFECGPLPLEGAIPLGARHREGLSEVRVHRPDVCEVVVLTANSREQQQSCGENERTGVTKWPDTRNQEAWGEGSHAEGQAGLAAGAPCLLPPHFNSLLKRPSTQGSECTR